LTDFTSALGGSFINPFKELKRARGAGVQSVAAASAQSVAGMATSLAKGALVDVPLALAEGMRNTPRLYGDRVKDHGPVTGWKSGSAVAVKVRIHFS